MPGTKPRFSINRLMFITSILAADCGLIRAVWDTYTLELAVIFLPSLNFMVLGLPGLGRGRGARPFWVGFELAAVTLLGLSWLLIWCVPVSYSIPLQWVSDNRWVYLADGRGVPEEVSIALFGCWAIVIYSIPQLFLALLVGWFTSRYRVVIERRPQAPDSARSGLEEGRGAVRRALPALGRSPRPAVE